MDNNKIPDNKLEKVTGGLETVFHGNTPICPRCGQPNLKLVTGDEFVDQYYCDYCGLTSTHTKKEKPAPVPIHPTLQCSQCGMVGHWNLIKTVNGVDYLSCSICHLEKQAPAE